MIKDMMYIFGLLFSILLILSSYIGEEHGPLFALLMILSYGFAGIIHAIESLKINK